MCLCLLLFLLLATEKSEFENNNKNNINEWTNEQCHSNIINLLLSIIKPNNWFQWIKFVRSRLMDYYDFALATHTLTHSLPPATPLKRWRKRSSSPLLFWEKNYYFCRFVHPQVKYVHWIEVTFTNGCDTFCRKCAFFLGAFDVDVHVFVMSVSVCECVAWIDAYVQLTLYHWCHIWSMAQRWWTSGHFWI